MITRRLNNYFIGFLSMLFFMMLVFPYLYLEIKVAFIGLILFTFIMYSRIQLAPRYQMWIFLFFLMNCVYFLYGQALGNPGINYYYLVYLVWPVLYFFFCSAINRSIIEKLINILYYAFFLIVIVGVFVFLQANGILPEIINIEFWGIEYVDRPLFMFQVIKSGSTVSFIFLLPFFLTLYIIDEKLNRFKFSRIILVLSLIYLFATSRRAIIFSLFYIPFLIYYFEKFSNARKFKGNGNKTTVSKLLYMFGIPIVLILFISVYFNLLDMTLFTDMFTASFSSDDTSLGNERDNQFVALIEGWKTSPFFGVGPGIDASVSRSDIPGMYELTYISLLFSRGFFGFVIYFIQIIVLLYWGLMLSRYDDSLRKYLIAFNVAFVVFLISNGSNPYLEAYDHMWVVFLYIALQNVVLKSSIRNETGLRSNTGI